MKHQQISLSQYLMDFFQYSLRPKKRTVSDIPGSINSNEILNSDSTVDSDVSTTLHGRPLGYTLGKLLLGFIILFGIQFLALGALSPLLGLEDIPHAMTELLETMPMTLLFAIAVLIMPAIEEMFFRFPLKFFGASVFPYTYIIFTILFALAHSMNFDLPMSDWWKIPILTLPQLILGFYLSFVRMHYGIFYSILIHMCNNLIPMTMLIAAEAFGIPLQ